MPDGQLDATSRATFAHAIEALHEEFRPGSCTASPASACARSPKPKEPS